MYERLTALTGAASANLRGILWMFGATLFFTVMHAAIRHATAEVPPAEIAFFRNLFGLLFLAPMFLRYGLASLRTERFGLHLFRSVVNLINMIAFYIGLSLTPLAEATALNFTAPLFTALLAMLFLGERLRLRRSAALLLGFLGAIVVLRPGVGEVNIGALYVIFAAILWGGLMIIIKILSRTDSSFTITTWTLILMTIMSLPPAVFVWIWPTAEQYFWLAFIAITGTIGQLMLTQALKEAEATAVTPIDFFRLIWASAIGYVAFTEVPDVYTWVGGTVIFGSATYIAFRERRLQRSGPAAANDRVKSTQGG